MSRTSVGAGAVAAVSAALVITWLALGQGAPKKVPPRPEQPAATGSPGGAGAPSPPDDDADTRNHDDIPLASPHAAAVETPSAPDAWGGPRTGTEPTLSNRVTEYVIEASLDPRTHVIDAHETLTWRNRSSRPVKSVYVHLYLNAFEGPGSTFFTEARRNDFEFRRSVSLRDGEWGHIELTRVEQNGAAVPHAFVHPDGGPETDHTVVRFDLPSPVAAGASTSLEIAFRDQLPRVVARTGWFGTFHMVGQWFPKIGVLELAGERGATEPRWNAHEFHMHSEFYADFGAYDVRITVPKGFAIAAAGEEEGAPVERDGRVTRRFVQGDIHDFAWMAADNFAPPLEGAYDGPGSPHVKVSVFYPPEYKASAEPAKKATIDSIKWFSETLGPYPYRTSTCIIPPFNAEEAGGMEYQTLFTTISYADVEPATRQAALLDFVTIHEFGHGYFYGLLASNEFEEPLLDEGLNEYWDARMLRTRGNLHLAGPFLQLLGVDPEADAFAFERGGGALDEHPADPIGQNSWDRLSSRTYGQVYSRTTTVMHDLEERIGHDAMERGFRAYYARWHFRHPSVADLREALADESGNRAAVEQVFRQNVYRAESVDDRVESLASVEELPEPGTFYQDGKWVERTEEAIEKEIKQARADWEHSHPEARKGEGPYPFRTTVIVRRDGVPVPQTLLVRFEDGSTETVHWDDDRAWHRFIFSRPVKAQSAQLDPERRMYLDYTKLNDGRTREPDGSASRRWAADAFAIVEMIASLFGAL